MDSRSWLELGRALSDLEPLRLPSGPVIATGGGLSAFAAQWWAERLQASGGRARYVPLGAFAGGDVDRGAARVVFSQGLSPNARLALDEPPRAGLWVVTAASVDRLRELQPGARRVGIPSPAGPAPWTTVAAQAAAVLQLTGGPMPRAEPAWVPRVDHPPDLILHGPRAAPLAGWLAWALMETTRRPAAPAVEALDFAHGMLQALVGRRARVWLLPDPGRSGLWRRVRNALSQARAFVTDFGSDGAPLGPWIRALTAASRWPAAPAARIDDGPLYGLERRPIA